MAEAVHQFAQGVTSLAGHCPSSVAQVVEAEIGAFGLLASRRDLAVNAGMQILSAQIHRDRCHSWYERHEYLADARWP